MELKNNQCKLCKAFIYESKFDFYCKNHRPEFISGNFCIAQKIDKQKANIEKWSKNE